MTVRVLLFATLRERAGRSEERRDLERPITVGALWNLIRSEHPRLREYRGTIAFAVNQEYVDSDHTVQDNDEVAFIPPVSGGAQV